MSVNNPVSKRVAINEQFISALKDHQQQQFFRISQSKPLQGTVTVSGAKNAVLVIISSLLLVDGESTLDNVPYSADVINMIALLKLLGARIVYFHDLKRLKVDTSCVSKWVVSKDIMKKMRASVLVMGPLLQRFGRASIVLPGGCLIGARPIDYHFKALARFGVEFKQEQDTVVASAERLRPAHIVLEYPSVGATENALMLASMVAGTSSIINASLEPEVINLIDVLKKMGAIINVLPPATLEIQGVKQLKPVRHSIMPDRLEAGALLIATAITGGAVQVKGVRVADLMILIYFLEQMGHKLEYTADTIYLQATDSPQAVSFRTSPHPGFPTDLQAPMMVAQSIAMGESVIHETVFENRFLHIRELQKFGAQIEVRGDRAFIKGVSELYGVHAIATDIRASSALVLAGLIAKGVTLVSGIHHWQRGYEALEKKLISLGADMVLL